MGAAKRNAPRMALLLGVSLLVAAAAAAGEEAPAPAKAAPGPVSCAREVARRGGLRLLSDPAAVDTAALAVHSVDLATGPDGARALYAAYANFASDAYRERCAGVSGPRLVDENGDGAEGLPSTPCLVFGGDAAPLAAICVRNVTDPVPCVVHGMLTACEADATAAGDADAAEDIVHLAEEHERRSPAPDQPLPLIRADADEAVEGATEGGGDHYEGGTQRTRRATLANLLRGGTRAHSAARPRPAPGGQGGSLGP